MNDIKILLNPSKILTLTYFSGISRLKKLASTKYTGKTFRLANNILSYLLNLPYITNKR